MGSLTQIPIKYAVAINCHIYNVIDINYIFLICKKNSNYLMNVRVVQRLLLFIYIIVYKDNGVSDMGSQWLYMRLKRENLFIFVEVQ